MTADEARSARSGRFVTVTKAQRRAARTMVDRSRKSGRVVPDAVRKIADATPVDRA